MKSKSYALMLYIMVFFASVWQISRETQAGVSTDFNSHMEKLSYQLDYPHIYSPVFSPYSDLESETVNTGLQQKEKTVYLTFDDGPSPRTGEILDILKKHNIKATFFVIKTKDEYIPYMKMAVEEGHAIGVHSYTHKYKEIYAGIDAYLADFTRCYEYIYENTGFSPAIYRFPGGSVNNHNQLTRKEIVDEMSRRGYIYFDWNVESGDSASGVSRNTIYNNVIDGCKDKNRAVIIMHDSNGKNSTVQALDDIIETLKADGWQFAPLTNEVKPVIFKMK